MNNTNTYHPTVTQDAMTAGLIVSLLVNLAVFVAWLVAAIG